MTKIIQFFKTDLLFTISFLAALLSLGFGLPGKETIDYKMLSCLFALMLLIKNIENLGVLNFLAEKIIHFSKDTRSLIISITLLSFFSSMLLTNDVAILTLMPIYLKITKKLKVLKDPLTGAVLLIIAANLGSSFFPFGNPQNLYLMSHFSLSASDFFQWSFILLVASLGFLCLSFLFIEKKKLTEKTVKLKSLNQKHILLLSLTGLLILSAVFNLSPYEVSIPLAVTILLFYSPQSGKQVDYRLLATFLFFFIAVGGFSQIPGAAAVIKEQFKSSYRTFLGSIALSQIISNVPAVILIAPFTSHIKALFFGVNIGGLGTLIASLANLIGFKIYRVYYPGKDKQFLTKFSLLNLLFLAGMIVVFLFFLN
ncbi:SLC13 family permease [Enterococcus sp. LJL51]|uniref:SLC13 family permease n=1 Tax=Enterococcus sp. LJL51 TaxID=3416656 RepID=UPI003CE75A90